MAKYLINPIHAYKEIKDDFLLYIKTAFGTRYESIEREREQLLRTDQVASREPWIEPLPSYENVELENGEKLKISTLRPSDVPGMNDNARQLFKEFINRGLISDRGKPNGDFPIYKHQAEMLKKALSGENCIITSGTGSGKTESFMLPMLADIISEAEKEWKHPESYSENAWWKGNNGQPLKAEDIFEFPDDAVKGTPGKLSAVAMQRPDEQRDAAVRALIIYPMNALVEDQMTRLRDALDKLALNDASLTFEPETSAALGFGFRCGFLGLLHMEIIQERLEREYNLDLITTAPSVIYKVNLTNGETKMIDNPSNYPDPALIASAEEPMVTAHIFTPQEFVGNIMELCQDRRGNYIDMKYLDDTRVDLHYELPLGEIVYDFFDALKSRTRGYASFDYEMKGYQPSKLVKLDILLNGEVVDALSFIVHTDKAYSRGRKICERLKDNIPRQLFEIPVQASIGGKIIARETVKAMRKDVLAKCYGGDITRKKKLLEKQKEGKKRMRKLGSVEVPQEAFMSVLKLDE